MIQGSDNQNAEDFASRRHHPRTNISVLSEVFEVEGTTVRYIGPGMVLDVSEDGLALAMDEPPRGAPKLLVKNAYFDVHAQIVNRTSERDCTRLGMRFVSKPTWYRPLTESSSSAPAAQRRSSPVARPTEKTPPNPAKAMWYERYRLYRNFLAALDRARSKLPMSILSAAALEHDVRSKTAATAPICRWHERYRVGVKELDAQHERLIEGLNSLAAALSVNDASILIVFDDLVFNLRTHCDDEELFMCWHAYPELEEHQVEHNRLLARFADIRRAFVNHSATLNEEVMQELVWRLNNHIMESDQQYVQYIASVTTDANLAARFVARVGGRRFVGPVPNLPAQKGNDAKY